MARLIEMSFQRYNATTVDGAIQWSASSVRKRIPYLPQLVWDDGTPFRAANLWALQRSDDGLLSPLTVKSNLSKLLPYANFLENNEIDWRHFPQQRSEQCLIRFRGHLIACRGSGEISPNETTQRMRVVIQFYRFLRREGLIDPQIKLWKERRFSIQTFDQNGFDRTINISTTDLSIPNRQRHGLKIEGGLQPLTKTASQELMTLAKAHSPLELQLMIHIGLTSGLRIGTITDLKVSTLMNAVPDPAAPGNRFINVGPGAKPPVSTKFSVTGQVSLPGYLVKQLLTYAWDIRRIKRREKSSKENSDLLFLTKSGKPYSSNGANSSSAIRSLVKKIRDAAKKSGNAELSNFKFHQTRATFATRLTAHLLKSHPANHVLAFIKRALLVKSEATALHYIRFVEDTHIKNTVANDYTRTFLGIEDEAN